MLSPTLFLLVSTTSCLLCVPYYLLHTCYHLQVLHAFVSTDELYSRQSSRGFAQPSPLMSLVDSEAAEAVQVIHTPL